MTNIKISKSLIGNKRRLGIPHTEEIRNKIGNSLRGKKHSEETKKRMSEASKGKKKTPEHRRKMSEARKKRVGSKSSNWKGGISSNNERIRGSEEYKLWRTAIFKRDKYTCIWCGDHKSGNLEVDHILPFADYPEHRLSIDNGRTLCKSCHIKRHKIK